MTGPVRAAGWRPATLLAVLAAAGLGSLGWLPLSPAPAAAARACVGVVVDARLLGGELRTGCAEGDPDSGLEALTMAGFGYSFVPRQPGLVCQVDGVPECDATGTTTYWSYWYRAKGSRTWVYSPLGAGAHDPAPGSSEGWVWQDGGRREPPDVSLTSICPQLAAAPGTGPPATPTGTPAPGSAPSKVPASGGAAAANPSRRTTGLATTPAASGDHATGSATAAARPEGPPTDPGPGSASWVGPAVGAGLVAALAAAALARSRRPGGAQ